LRKLQQKRLDCLGEIQQNQTHVIAIHGNIINLKFSTLRCY